MGMGGRRGARRGVRNGPAKSSRFHRDEDDARGGTSARLILSSPVGRIDRFDSLPHSFPLYPSVPSLLFLGLPFCLFYSLVKSLRPRWLGRGRCAWAARTHGTNTYTRDSPCGSSVPLTRGRERRQERSARTIGVRVTQDRRCFVRGGGGGAGAGRERVGKIRIHRSKW